MLARSVAMGLGVLALGFLLNASVEAAADKSTHEGTVVSVTGNKLVMTTAGKEHSHVIEPDTKITLDRKPAQLEDLKPGMHIKVTTTTAGKVTDIKATQKKPVR